MILKHIGIIIGLTMISYLIFTKLRFPAPSVMGPMIFIGAYQVMGGGIPEVPAILSNSFLIIIGLSVGTKINQNSLGDIKKIGGPSLLIAGYTLASTAIMTVLIRNFTSDFPTALFSAAPGGIAEMSIMGLEYDAEIAIISTFQFMRLFIILSIIPLFAKALRHRISSYSEDREDTSSADKDNIKQGLSAKGIALYLVGISGGLLLIALGMPGGGIIGAMAALGVGNILSGEVFLFPKKVMGFALLGVGITIGLEFSPLMLAKIQQMFLPIMGFSILIVLGNLLIGWVIRCLFHWDTITCLLSSAPGGLTQMIVVGEEMQADTLKISILQLVRVLTILTSIPLIAALMA